MILFYRAVGLTVAALALAFAGSALALDSGVVPPVVVKQLAKTAVTDGGQPIVLPQTDARVIASIFDIAADATLPVHKHPFPRYAYVLAGELRVTNVETGEGRTYRTGDFIVEMVGRWHQGQSLGGKPVKLLVIDQIEGDAPHTVARD